MVTIYDAETGASKEVTQKQFEMLNILDVVFAQQTNCGVRWCFDNIPLLERVLGDMELSGEN